MRTSVLAETQRLEKTCEGRAYISPCRNYCIIDLDERRVKATCEGLDRMIRAAAWLASPKGEDLDLFALSVRVVFEAYREGEFGAVEDAGVSHLAVSNGLRTVTLMDESMIREMNEQLSSFAAAMFP